MSKFTVGQTVWHTFLLQECVVVGTHVEPEFVWSHGEVDASFGWVDVRMSNGDVLGGDENAFLVVDNVAWDEAHEMAYEMSLKATDGVWLNSVRTEFADDNLDSEGDESFESIERVLEQAMTVEASELQVDDAICTMYTRTKVLSVRAGERAYADSVAVETDDGQHVWYPSNQLFLIRRKVSL